MTRSCSTSLLAVAVLLVLTGTGTRAEGQTPSPAMCEVGGSVHARSLPLPGVVVTVVAPHATVTASTEADGQWRGRLPAGQYRVTYDLRGFTTAPVELVVTPEACPGPLDREMLVASVRPSVVEAPPADVTAVPVPPRIIEGRQATLNRAALRDRAAASARGELTPQAPTGASWLVSGVGALPGTPPAAAPIDARTLTRASGTPPATAAQAAPRRPVVPAQRLYSATGSYTMATSALDSAPYQLRADTAQPKPDYFRNSVDFSVGGPLGVPGLRPGASKTNVTLSYSAIRGTNLFDQYATVPTAAMRAGDFSEGNRVVSDPLTGTPFPGGIIPADRLDPTALALLSYVPLPNGAGSTRNFHRTATNRSNQDTLNLRVTRPLIGNAPATGGRGGRGRGAPPTARSATLNGQVDFRRNVNDRLTALPTIGGVGTTVSLRVPVSLNITRPGVQHSVSLTFTRNRTTTSNQYAYTRNVAAEAGIAGAAENPFAWGVPSLAFASLSNINDLTPSDRTDRRLTLNYTWSKGVGAHRLRVGGDVGALRSDSRTDQNARGSFVFTGLYSGSDVADFLLGQPQQASVQYGPGLVRLAGHSLNGFVQDDWRRWSAVTINAGLRYELVSPFRDTAGQLVNLDVAPGFTAVAPVVSGGTGRFSGTFPAALIRTDINNVAPRVGAAWRVAARTTLRVGYGVSYNTGAYATLARQLASQPPFAVTNTSIGSLAQPLALSSALTQGTSATTNSFGVARDYQAGQVGTWTVDLNRDMGDAWNLSAGLTYARGRHLDIQGAPNRGPSGLRLPDVQPFLWQSSDGRSRLRSATVRVRRWYVRGFSFSANYTLAQSMDNASTIGGGATVVAQDEQNLAAEWGRSSFDRRHQLSGDLNFELPFGQNHRWLNRGNLWGHLASAWSAYITFGVQSGSPLTARVLSSSADVARGTNGTLRADVTGLPVALASPGVDRFFNTAAFAIPQPGTFGSASRNTITGPANRDLHLQLTRDLPAGGTRTLSVQIRANNVLNLVNYAGVDAVVNSPTFGQVVSVRPMRSLQLNVRWKF